MIIFLEVNIEPALACAFIPYPDVACFDKLKNHIPAGAIIALPILIGNSVVGVVCPNLILVAEPHQKANGSTSYCRIEILHNISFHRRIALKNLQSVKNPMIMITFVL